MENEDDVFDDDSRVQEEKIIFSQTWKRFIEPLQQVVNLLHND